MMRPVCVQLLLVVLVVLLAARAASAEESVLFDGGEASSGWVVGTDSHAQISDDAETCEVSEASERFDLKVHESFYLQKERKSRSFLSGGDCVLLRFQSCDQDLLSELTFRAKFDGAFGRYILPEIPMSNYALKETEASSGAKDFTFLFPMAYLDSIWKNETFDRVVIKCQDADKGCELSLLYAAIIPAEDVRPVLMEELAMSENGTAQQLPFAPAQPLSYWLCSFFPFPWCPPPAPAPPSPLPPPPPSPIDPGDPDYEDDYEGDDEDGGGDNDDDYGDYEDEDERDLYFLRNARYEAYARPGRYGSTLRSVTCLRTYGFGSFQARIAVPSSQDDLAPFPVIVFGHGLGGSSRNYLTKMRHFASHGFVVIAPETFNLFDGGDMLESIPWLEGEAKNPASFLHERVDPTRVCLAGHSMGGAGSLAAASRYGADDAVKCVAAIHPAPLVSLGAVQVPAFISAGSADLTTPPLPIKGTIYDSRSLRGPKVMAVLQTAAHMEPVDGIGFQRWTPYLTAWFLCYLRADLEASTLIWGLTSPQSLQVNPQMAQRYSFPGMEVKAQVKKRAREGNATLAIAMAAAVKNAVDLRTQFEVLYWTPDKARLAALDVKPAITPLLSQDQSSAFEIAVDLVGEAPLPFYVICRSKYANGTTTATAMVTVP